MTSDWVIGGSSDARAEVEFGFGPKDAAVIAVEAFVLAAELSRGVAREEFVLRCAGAFLEGLRDVAGLPEGGDS